MVNYPQMSSKPTDELEHAPVELQQTPITTKKTRGRPRVENAHQNKLEYMKAYNKAHREQCNQNRTKYFDKCVSSYKLLKQLYEDEQIFKMLKTNAQVWSEITALFQNSPGGND